MGGGIMATTILITCPHCKKQLRGSSDLAGKKVRCQGCQNTFLIQANGADAAGPRTPPVDSTVTPHDSAAKRAAAPAKHAPAKPAPAGPANLGVSMYNVVTDEEAKARIEQAQTKSQATANVKAIQTDPAARGIKGYGVTETGLAPRCPHCAKEMPSADTVVCMNCGYNTQTRTHVGTKRTYDITSQDIFMWRLPGLICAGTAALFLLFIGFTWIALHPLAVKHEEAWWAWMDGLWFKIWGSVFAAFIVFFTAQFAFSRLVQHPVPPEIEKR
jgi:hypothetical protein